MGNDTSIRNAAAMAANHSLFETELPPLRSYTLEPQADLLSWISDFWLSLIVPVIVYWVLSLTFHFIDIHDLFPQYRLHTPEEITKRNRASRYEVARDVIMQQIIQVATGAVLALTEPPKMAGKAEYDIAVWATRVRLAQRALPIFLGALGLNATAISENLADSHPMLAGAVAGGYYPFTTDTAEPAFVAWEMMLAQAIYHIITPGVQFFVAIFILDTWQYFLHRLMHVNKWLYGELNPFASCAYP